MPRSWQCFWPTPSQFFRSRWKIPPWQRECELILKAPERRLEAYALLIPAQAMANRLMLITANQSEFSRIPGLRWRNWASEK